MKAEMLKRLVRAIAMGSQDDLDRLADSIVETERSSGHSRLASELESILDDKQKKKRSNRGGMDSNRSIRELSQNRAA